MKKDAEWLFVYFVDQQEKLTVEKERRNENNDFTHDQYIIGKLEMLRDIFGKLNELEENEMAKGQAINVVAELFGVQSFVLEMFIESYNKYKQVRFGPIELHDDSLSKFKDYIKEQRNLSHAIDSGATNQYEQMIELIDIYELEEVNK